MSSENKKLKRSGDTIVIPQQEFDMHTDEFEVIQKMEYYGATIAEQPPAPSVPVGAVFMAVDTGEIWQSNGTDWVVLG